jgi:16S rRNA G966 N2-methylase RsmD
MSDIRDQGQIEFGARNTSASDSYDTFKASPSSELSKFIQNNSTPLEANDDYDVAAFDQDLSVNKMQSPKAIYDMHSYWSKKHWAAIRQYIQHYLPAKWYPGGRGLVLDCFSGSGMTGVAALMEGRSCLLLDASPAAAFISHCYTHPVDPSRLDSAYRKMLASGYPAELSAALTQTAGRRICSLSEELTWLYETICDRCKGPATTDFVVYSEQFQCPNCNKLVTLYECIQLEVPHDGRYCPHCVKSHGGRGNRDYLISTRSRKFGSRPVAVGYTCGGRCKPKKATRPMNKADERHISVIEKAEIPHWYPKRKMMDVEDDSKPWGVKWRAGTSNFRTVAELYTKRNLWGLAAWLAALKRVSKSEREVELLELAFTGVCLGLSKMNRYRPNVTFPLNVMMGTYYVPQISAEANVTSHLTNKVKKICKSHEALLGAFSDSHILVSCESLACRKEPLQRNCVDYVFIDPGYVDKVQYGELNFVWEAWLGFPGDWLKQEIVVNQLRGKSLQDWDTALRKTLQRCFEMLKPGRWLSLCYHDTAADTWKRVQDMLLDTGFEIHTVCVLDPQQKSSNQLTGEKVVKGDLVVNCKKATKGPGPGNGDRLIETASQRVREIIVESLSQLGGQTSDKLWEIVLKRLLTRGQMAEHRFSDILSEVAFRSEAGRWFLKEEFETLTQSDIKNEEDAGDALERFARLRILGVTNQVAAQIAIGRPGLAGQDTSEEQIEKYIKENLLDSAEAKKKFRLSGRLTGVEFYDCLFFYLTRFLKSRKAGQVPRRNLAEFLEEYLVRFRDGDKWLYRPPDKAEALSLHRSRQSGLGRRIRQYVSYLTGQGEYPKDKIPEPKTLLAWLKHCSGFGLADEGVVLYERGGLMAQSHGLSEDERYDAEEYFLNCRRKASKSASGEEEEQLELENDEEEAKE